jgi:hypothetical protein
MESAPEDGLDATGHVEKEAPFRQTMCPSHKEYVWDFLLAQ